MLVAPESEATMLSGQDVSFVSDTDVVVDAKAIPVNCSNYVVDGDCIRAMYGLPDINVNKAVDPSNALGSCATSTTFGLTTADTIHRYFRTTGPDILS